MTYRYLGYDVVGMTACPEAQLAREAEMCYAVMAHVTDFDVWHETEESVSVEMLTKNLGANATLAQRAIEHFVGAATEAERHCACKDALSRAGITSHVLIPERVKHQLEPIIGRYHPVRDGSHSEGRQTSAVTKILLQFYSNAGDV